MTQSQLLQFVNCSILRNHEIIREDIWVRDGKIVNPEKMFFDEKISADVQIDCKGALISPGFIELQINGGFGVDFSCDFEDVEEGLRVVAKGILAHGVTSFCPTVVTSPAHVYNKGFDSVLETYGSLDNVRIVTVAPELEKAPEVIEKFVERGITVSLGHSMASLGEGEAAVKHGASFITHLFNAMLPFHHRDPGLVGLLASDAVPDDHVVYFGIISDGIHTHPAALRIAHRTHPKGLVLVTDAISALGLEEGMHQLGQLSVEVKAGCAYIAGTDTLCGSIATMSECVKFFKEATSCSIVEALEAATLHPAKALGIHQTKGSLHFGADADFIFLGKDMDLWSTWISGECVYQAKGKTEAACFCKVKRK
ncbi:N-acetylglucosamine-6-phosphate deacetylase isoform X2 [Schistocerca nitens]|uniref:N-acetylglucosamine-6-phosphate deacetylase isoform X2 n=1 Tax=Schistocerca nitens TaxID=7011 RepID=UPI002117D03E|nr:N-acetylglucosamine-6-phosphate deacetylase isoform X2 [Schistocerca nitens]